MKKHDGGQGKLLKFQSKEWRQTTLVLGEKEEHTTNDLFPPAEAQRKFRIPKNMSPEQLRDLAQTIVLSDIGVFIPGECPYPDRFEAGFRHGLASNALNQVGYLKRSFRWGFCWAKVFYKIFFPTHPLTANFAGGRAKLKNNVSRKDK